MCAIQHSDAPSLERIIIHEQRSVLSMFWTMTVVVIAFAALGLITSWRRRNRPEHLGTVSDHWIAEHRSGLDRIRGADVQARAYVAWLKQ